MNLPADFSPWGLILKLVLLLGSSVGLGWRLLSLIAAHSVCLSGRRIAEEKLDFIQYRFAIQNNEDVPLTGERRLVLRVLDAGGRLLPERPPRVYAGCNPIRTEASTDRRGWRMMFTELPAYESWTIVCTTERSARNLSLCIEDVEPADASVAGSKGKTAPERPRLSHASLTLPANKLSVFVGRKMTPEVWWAALAILSALVVYAGAFYFFVYQTYEDLRWWDVLAPVLIAAFGCALWWFTRRPAPAISQGYWTPTTPVAEPEQPHTETHQAAP